MITGTYPTSSQKLHSLQHLMQSHLHANIQMALVLFLRLADVKLAPII